MDPHSQRRSAKLARRVGTIPALRDAGVVLVEGKAPVIIRPARQGTGQSSLVIIEACWAPVATAVLVGAAPATGGISLTGEGMLAAAGLAGNVAGTLQCSDAIAGTLSPSTRQWIDSQPAYHAYKKTIGQISTVGGYLAISGTVLRATRVSALSGVNAARETWKDLSPTQKRDMAEWLLGKPGRLAPLIARGNLSGYLRTKLIDRWFWDRLLEVVIGTLDNVEKVVVTTMVPDDSPWRSRSQR